MSWPLKNQETCVLKNYVSYVFLNATNMKIKTYLKEWSHQRINFLVFCLIVSRSVRVIDTSLEYYIYKRLTYFHGTCIETFIHCYIVVNSVPWFEPFNRWVVFQINPLCEQFIRKWKRCNQCSRNAPFLTHQNLVVRSVKSVLKYIFTAVILWTKWSFMIWYVFRGHERIYVEVK